METMLDSVVDKCLALYESFFTPAILQFIHAAIPTVYILGLMEEILSLTTLAALTAFASLLEIELKW